MTDLLIAMPFVGALQYTRLALQSLKVSQSYHLLLIDNGSADDSPSFLPYYCESNNIKYTYLTGNRSVAESWNYAIQFARKNNYNYILIANNDVIFHPKTVDNLIKFIDKTNYAMVTATNRNDGTLKDSELINLDPKDFDEFDLKPITNWREEGPDFSMFMIKKEFPDTYGWIDENFRPAYYEDNSTHLNIFKLGGHAKRVSTAPYFHYGSKTIQMNPEVRKQIVDGGLFDKNKQYFLDKWGALPSETLDGQGYDFPFNDLNNKITYWPGCNKYDDL